MMDTIGFLGCGNMGGAIARAVCKAVDPKKVFLANRTAAKAQEYAAQMVLGSAKLVLESGKHPGELKDAVCSPGGSTIQGVRVLEEHGLRGAVMDAVIASYNKTKEMGKG